MDLEDLYEEIRTDPAFKHFRKDRNPLVPGEGTLDGARDCKAFLLGEAPGADEVLEVRPFVGRAGRILRALMANAGLYADAVADKTDWIVDEWHPNCWLTNTVKYRPPRNRTPTWEEIKANRNYIRQEWQLVGKPRLIVPVGGVALRCIMGKNWTILKHAGKPFWKKSEGATTHDPKHMIWPMLHPSYVMRQESLQPIAEKHWKELGIWIENNL